MNDKNPQIDLICNLVIRSKDGKILLVRYDAEDNRWWLPGKDLVPYEHPDNVVPKIIDELKACAPQRVTFSEIESFRGRTGWHVMFNYLVDVPEEFCENKKCNWFSVDQLPQTAHGKWEKEVIQRALAKVNI